MKCARLGSVRYVSVKETIDCEKTDAGARREVPMNAIYVNKKRIEGLKLYLGDSGLD